MACSRPAVANRMFPALVANKSSSMAAAPFPMAPSMSLLKNCAPSSPAKGRRTGVLVIASRAAVADASEQELVVAVPIRMTHRNH